MQVYIGKCLEPCLFVQITAKSIIQKAQNRGFHGILSSNVSLLIPHIRLCYLNHALCRVSFSRIYMLSMRHIMHLHVPNLVIMQLTSWWILIRHRVS